ncbi:MAG: ATP-binding protein, partial [Bacteroidota bacterium]|nr:ATP-binding protein [Bacteroidota bacterium]
AAFDLIMKALNIVITGGPGSGKTSICEYLRDNDYQTYPEGARQIIEQGIQPPIATANSQQDPGFGEKILHSRINDYLDSHNHELCFFDRGLPDGLAFSHFLNKEPDQTLLDAIDRYRYDHIFILTPWKEIYCQDSVRQESFEIAELISHYCTRAYKDSGYRLVEVPQLPIPERATFILNELRIELSTSVKRF